MKKIIKEQDSKSILASQKESYDLRKEIATMVLNSKVNPQKDTNAISKKRKKLAVLLTSISQGR